MERTEPLYVYNDLGQVVPATSREEWRAFMAENAVVKSTVVGHDTVVTHFTGQPFRSIHEGEVYFFVTDIRAFDAVVLPVARHATLEDARRQHDVIVDSFEKTARSRVASRPERRP